MCEMNHNQQSWELILPHAASECVRELSALEPDAGYMRATAHSVLIDPIGEGEGFA
jgi:hypothetical protein